jgi:hypothetical protein
MAGLDVNADDTTAVEVLVEAITLVNEAVVVVVLDEVVIMKIADVPFKVAVVVTAVLDMVVIGA